MRMNGNEITIQRGEAFTIDKVLINEDGSPYIVPYDIYDARLVLRISNSKYQTDKRYVKEYTIRDFERLETEMTVNLKEILSSPSGEPCYPNGFSDIVGLTPVTADTFEGMCVAAGWYNGQYIYFTPGDVVFYVIDQNGKRHYKYWPDYDSEGWEDYEFRFIISFPSTDTLQWVAQTYYWSLTVESYDGSDVRVLISPTKLSVLSNLRGGN